MAKSQGASTSTQPSALATAAAINKERLGVVRLSSADVLRGFAQQQLEHEFQAHKARALERSDMWWWVMMILQLGAVLASITYHSSTMFGWDALPIVLGFIVYTCSFVWPILPFVMWRRFYLRSRNMVILSALVLSRPVLLLVAWPCASAWAQVVPIVMASAGTMTVIRVPFAAVVLRLSVGVQCLVVAGHTIFFLPAHAALFGAALSLPGFVAMAVFSLVPCYYLDWRMRRAFLQTPGCDAHGGRSTKAG